MQRLHPERGTFRKQAGLVGIVEACFEQMTLRKKRSDRTRQQPPTAPSKKRNSQRQVPIAGALVSRWPAVSAGTWARRLGPAE